MGYGGKEALPTLKYHLPESAGEEEKARYSIAAHEIVQAVRSGRAVDIQNAVIRGSFILRSANVEQDISIKGTTITDSVDWSYATFNGVVTLEGVIFEKNASFRGVKVEKDIFFDQGTFKGEADFTEAWIGGSAGFFRAKFRQSIIFNSVQVGRHAHFSSAIFKGQASFNSTRIAHHAFFDRTIFQGKTNFIGVQIGGGAEFNRVRFRQLVNFNSIQCSQHANFTSGIFRQDVTFSNSQFKGGATFSQVAFRGQATFLYVQIEGPARFVGAIFRGFADFTAWRGKRTVFQLATFEGSSTFDGAQFEGSVFFVSATFKGEANFEGTRISGIAQFTEATFKQGANFVGISVQGDALFDGVTFFKDVSFRSASFRTISFGLRAAQFQGKIDLRGCRYDRIEPLSIWKTLIAQERLDPYDRQPFTQLEETFRRAGDDHQAKAVYFERKRRESAQIPKWRILALSMDWFHWALTGYGVKLRYLIGWILLSLGTGTLIFHLQGAVEPKQDTQMLPVIGPQNELRINRDVMLPLSWVEAFWVSLRFFFPVEIPAGENWRPSSKLALKLPELQTPWGLWVWGIRFATCATVLKLAGWLLIPLRVAGLTGILKR